jgi:hypothetical protein
MNFVADTALLYNQPIKKPTDVTVLKGIDEFYDQVEVFRDVTSYSVAVRYQRFGGLCCFHLQGED